MTNQTKTIPHLHIKLAGTGFGIQMHKRAFLDDAIAGAKDLWGRMDDNERTALTVGGLGAAGAGIGGIFGGLRGALAGGLGGVGAGAAIRGRHIGQLLGLGKKPVDIDPRTVGTPMGGAVDPGAAPRKPGQEALDAYRAWSDHQGDSGNLGEPSNVYDQIGGFDPTKVDPAIADSNIEGANIWNQSRLAQRNQGNFDYATTDRDVPGMRGVDLDGAVRDAQVAGAIRNQGNFDYVRNNPYGPGGGASAPGEIVAEGMRNAEANRIGELGNFEADPYQPQPLAARLEEGLQRRREQIAAQIQQVATNHLADFEFMANNPDQAGPVLAEIAAATGAHPDIISQAMQAAVGVTPAVATSAPTAAASSRGIGSVIADRARRQGMDRVTDEERATNIAANLARKREEENKELLTRSEQATTSAAETARPLEEANRLMNAHMRTNPGSQYVQDLYEEWTSLSPAEQLRDAPALINELRRLSGRQDTFR